MTLDPQMARHKGSEQIMRYLKPELAHLGTATSLVRGDYDAMPIDQATGDGGDPDLGKPFDIVAGLDD